jgi:protein-S-isoprenylcysteine O-methyltransferase Ste14
MNIHLDSLRYLVSLCVLLLAPPSLLIWLLIHPLARLWRRIGVLGSYLCFISLMILLGSATWRMKSWLLGMEYGSQLALGILSVICICISVWIASKREKQLGFSAVIGIPELSKPNLPRVLVTRGVYAWVRNPRYIETVLFVLGCAFFANYLAIYLIWLAGLPLVHFVVLLEERELYLTFGDEFLIYCDRVPRYIPKRFW